MPSYSITAEADNVNDHVFGLFLPSSWGALAFGRNSGGVFYTGLRFLNVIIGQGATVSAATLTLNVTAITEGSPSLPVRGVAEDNSPAFDSGNRPRNDTLTTASALAAPSGTGNLNINVTGIVQEMVNRAGWASGNAMAFVVRSDDAEVSEFQANWYDDASGNEPVLDITIGEAPVAATSFRHPTHPTLG